MTHRNDRYGYYGIVGAAFAGMIGNHLMLIASRLFVWWRSPLGVVQEEAPVALMMRASWFPRVLVPAILVGCFVLIIIMLQRPAFVFAFQGTEHDLCIVSFTGVF